MKTVKTAKISLKSSKYFQSSIQKFLKICLTRFHQRWKMVRKPLWIKVYVCTLYWSKSSFTQSSLHSVLTAVSFPVSWGSYLKLAWLVRPRRLFWGCFEADSRLFFESLKLSSALYERLLWDYCDCRSQCSLLLLPECFQAVFYAICLGW